MAGRAFRVIRNVALGTTAGAGVLYAWDQHYNYRALSRTAYAVYSAVVIGIDYKLHFKEGQDIAALHNRNAQRLLDVIRSNKGLYVKVGQSIAVQGNMLPEPYRVLLSSLFDDAPQDSWKEAEATLRQELGKDPGDVFAYIDPTPVASASIAQVHKARLLSGEDVAVKVQHADIPNSTFWDLTTYKALIWVYDRFVFKMPMYFVGKYIADQVQKETDFRIELQNAQKMRELVQADNETRDAIYIPQVNSELSSMRVLVMEWIEGASLNNPEAVKQADYDVKKALTNVFKVLTKEAFEWGVVHSDPHPGNWILRHHPEHPGRQQLVMLDHGLYVYMSEKLREEYAQLWRAMFKRNLPEITRITSEWGFGDPKLFASATMLQPYDDEVRDLARNDSFGREAENAERFRQFLKDTERVPLELVFVGRTQRILQGLNQKYGSPVNRMHILVDEALKVPASVSEKNSEWRYPLAYRFLDWMYRRVLLLAADLIFLSLRVRQLFTHQDPETVFDEAVQQNSMEILAN